MYLRFKEKFELPLDRVFPYFATPADWALLYGVVKPTKKRKDGWYSIPLAKFPFPLVAKNVEAVTGKKVRWIFGGFWRGVGEVNFKTEKGHTVIEGYEYICPHGFWILSTFLEKAFMEKEFARIWELGWKRIRKNEDNQSC